MGQKHYSDNLSKEFNLDNLSKGRDLIGLNKSLGLFTKVTKDGRKFARNPQSTVIQSDF